MSDFLQTVVMGLGNGAIYAFLALALVLIFRSTGIVNFAQGEMGMFSAFLVWALVSAGMNIFLAIVLVLAVSFAMGGAVEIAFFRKFRGDMSSHAPTTITMGLFLMFSGIAGAIWLYEPKTLNVFPRKVFSIGDVYISSHVIGALAVLLIALLGIYLLLHKTRLGLSLRAAVSNQESAGLSGVNTELMLSLGWCLAAVLGTLAAVMAAPSFFLSPKMMASVLAYALAGAALGGFGSLPGAVVGALFIGVVESLASGYMGFIGTDLKVLIPAVVLFVVLLIRPEGLFGRKEVNRV